MCSVKSMDLSYECLTSAKVTQAIIGLRLTNPQLYKEITAPSASVLPVPPPSGGQYAEDEEDVGQDDGDIFLDSALSVEEAISQIIDLPNTRVPLNVYGEEDEGIDGYNL